MLRPRCPKAEGRETPPPSASASRPVGRQRLLSFRPSTHPPTTDPQPSASCQWRPLPGSLRQEALAGHRQNRAQEPIQVTLRGSSGLRLQQVRWETSSGVSPSARVPPPQSCWFVYLSLRLLPPPGPQCLQNDPSRAIQGPPSLPPPRGSQPGSDLAAAALGANSAGLIGGLRLLPNLPDMNHVRAGRSFGTQS